MWWTGWLGLPFLKGLRFGDDADAAFVLEGGGDE